MLACSTGDGSPKNNPHCSREVDLPETNAWTDVKSAIETSDSNRRRSRFDESIALLSPNEQLADMASHVPADVLPRHNPFQPLRIYPTDLWSR